MVHPPHSLLSSRLSSLLILAVVLTELMQSGRKAVVHAFPRVPRGGQSPINGHPRRVTQSSSMLMKKRGKKQGKNNKNEDNDDLDGIGELFLDDLITGGVVARLEAIYGMDTAPDKDNEWILQTKRTTIVADDWSELAEGPCLGDCCGDECDEVSLP
jgi:hypothetical protein